MNGLTGNKRKADALSLLAKSSSKKSGRGSLAGWTLCPLCGRHSKKRYALGRGISSHLHAAHTPWNPGRIELNMRRKRIERLRTERGKCSNTVVSHSLRNMGTDVELKLETWTPSQNEIEKWDVRVLEIAAQLESQSVRLGDSIDMSAGGEFAGRAGMDRSGNATQSYRASLPPFIQAAADGNLQKLKEMVAADGESVHKLLATRDRHLSTAEHWAAGSGDLRCLKFLLDCAKKYSLDEASLPKKVRRRDGKTSLHYAARNGHVGSARYLIEDQGYYVDEASGDGTTPLHMACFGGHLSVAEYLIRAGARVDASNDWGCTAAHWVAMIRSESPNNVRSLCRLLLSNGLSFTKLQKQGHSPLHKAAQVCGRLTCVPQST
jgi:hypothetical protein